MDIVQEGFYFYWFMWMLWIIFFFFFPKTATRIKWTMGILIIVALSGVEISLSSALTINCSVFGLLFLSGLLMSEQSNYYFLTLCSFSLSIGFSGLLFFEQISPVLMIFPRMWLFSFILTLVLFYVSNVFIQQASILTLGLVMGDILHSFIIYSYGMEKLTVGLPFLDVWATTLMMLFVLEGVRNMVFKVDQIVENHTQTKTRWIR
ncbi:hypothetical protein RZN25_05115 [Bacillaceae bacterium S4-13-56]